MRQFVYPADVKRDEAGYFLVTFPDFPEAGTDGETLEEVLVEAADCLAEAVAGCLARAENIPKASRKQKGQYALALPAQIAAKAALYLAMQEAGIDKSDLARRLGCDMKEVRRLLNPKQPAELTAYRRSLSRDRTGAGRWRAGKCGWMRLSPKKEKEDGHDPTLLLLKLGT